MPTVYWAALLERSTQDNAVQTLLDVASHAGQMGYRRLRWPYSRTDVARNSLVAEFQRLAGDPDDALVMLDNDHLMPPDVITRLLAWNQGVVGALAFRRGVPYFPCFFVKQDGAYQVMLEYEAGLIECALVGTGAIAIRRRVFDALDEAGYGWPYFRYAYPKGEQVHPSEDIYFGQICEKAGIPHHVDTTFCIPHITAATIDEESWKQFQADHPEMESPGYQWSEAMKGNVRAAAA